MIHSISKYRYYLKEVGMRGCPSVAYSSGRFNLALKGKDYFLGRGLHPSLNKGFKKPLPKGRGLLHEIKSGLALR
jgi:hypothetical protein